MKQATLVLLRKAETSELLLAMKKRGFGMGKWNGVGGKVNPEEIVATAACREAQEEVGVTILPEHLQPVAIIDFAFEDKPEFNMQANVFFVDMWQGEAIESEEMRPQWFAYDQIPYNEMWIDDIHWLPRVLAGEKLFAKFTFSHDGSEIRESHIETIK